MSKTTTNKLTIKDENVILYWVDVNEGGPVSSEEMQKIDEANVKFKHGQLMPSLMERLKICNCQMQRIYERAQRRAAILGANLRPNADGSITADVQQEDIDTVQFGVILGADHRRFNDVRMVVTKCKGCGDVHIWGELEPIMRMFAVAFDKYTSEEQLNPLGDSTAEFVMEDIDTGELHSAENLGEALFGKGSPDNLKMEDISDTDSKGTKEKVICIDECISAKDDIEVKPE